MLRVHAHSLLYHEDEGYRGDGTHGADTPCEHHFKGRQGSMQKLMYMYECRDTMTAVPVPMYVCTPTVTVQYKCTPTRFANNL